MPEPKHRYDEQVEAHLTSIIYSNEYQVAKQNQSWEIEDFQAAIDLFDAIRSEKDYDWMSDIFIPEFPAHMLTQTSIDVSQYFQTRDFVEVYVQDESNEALAAADATKELLNRTLNRRDLYHYQKFVRAKNVNNIKGNVILKCWWEQDIANETVGVDDYNELVEEEVIRKDQFNYDIVDPRNIFTDNKYAYSLQQKAWVTIRDDVTLEDLKREQATKGYFNLELLVDRTDKQKSKGDKETETKRETRDDSTPQQTFDNKLGKHFDRFERYGKFWIMPDGSPGIDEFNNVKEGAELKEMVATIVTAGGTKVLIAFHEQPYKDAFGNAFRPLIRALCYVHPTTDGGAGDGKYARELQVAINDTFNLGNDRTRLATMPTMKGKKYVTEDTDSIFFEPGHMMELNEPADVEEFKIDDNIDGSLNQIGLLCQKMQEVDSIYPTTMGQLPAIASTTATAVAGAEQKTNQRANYKTMTFEFTGLTELYWMIQQMTWQYAKKETGIKLMGEKIYAFDPQFEFYYKPLSQSIETENSKAVKIQRWIQLAQIMATIQHPDTVKAFNYILTKVSELQGDEYANFANMLMNPNVPIETGGSQGQGAGGGGGTSNQYQVPQSGTESTTREVAGERGLMGA